MERTFYGEPTPRPLTEVAQRVLDPVLERGFRRQRGDGAAGGLAAFAGAVAQGFERGHDLRLACRHRWWRRTGGVDLLPELEHDAAGQRLPTPRDRGEHGLVALQDGQLQIGHRAVS